MNFADGYNVYDFLEQYKYQGKEWMKIFKHGGTTEDFRRMFENVDAVTDVPACYFWDEIHKAFPDAKVTCRNIIIIVLTICFLNQKEIFFLRSSFQFAMKNLG